MEAQRQPKEASLRFSDEPGYTVEMTIKPGCKGFEIEIHSDDALNATDIIQIMQNFFYENLVDESSLVDLPEHKTEQ